MNNYLFFVKGRGNVGTLQNIVVICIWITIISLLLSVLSFIFDNRICNLIGNYFMGIFCSSIVALITTIIQFCRERNLRWKEFNNIVFRLTIALYKYSTCDEKSTEDDILRNYDVLKDCIDDFYDFGNTLYWFNNRKEDLYNVLMIKLTFIVTVIFVNYEKSNIRPLSFEEKKCFYVAVKKMSLLSNEYYIGMTNVYEELRKDLCRNLKKEYNKSKENE